MTKNKIQTCALVDKKIIFFLFLYILTLLFFGSKMSPLYPHNEWADINLYFNIGKSIANGRTLYTEVFDHKGPLIFLIYEIGYLISNTSFLGMYIIQVLAWTVMAYAVYLLSRLYLDRLYAFIATLLFILIFSTQILQGGSAEEFIAICIAISLYFFAKYFDDEKIIKHKALHMFIHGALCSITFFIKLNLVVFWIFPLLAIFLILLLNKEYRSLYRNLAACVGGVLVVMLPICLYLFLNNALSEAWNIYIVLNQKYALMEPLPETIRLLCLRTYKQMLHSPIGFGLVLVGAIYFPFRYIKNRILKIGVILSFGTLFISITMVKYCLPYYVIPYYVFSALGCISIVLLAKKYVKLPDSIFLYILFPILFLSIGIYNKNFFNEDINVLLRKVEPQELEYSFAETIKKEKDQTLFTIGLDKGVSIFTLNNIIPNVKYFVSPNLSYDMYPGMRDEQTKYIEQKKVNFVVVADYSHNTFYFLDLPALKENYTLVNSALEGGIVKYFLYKRND